MLNNLIVFKKGEMAIIIGHPNNKIHLYSLKDFQLKFCLDSDFQQNKIISIAMSKKTKFFSILYNDYNLEIYNLLEEKKVNQTCNCIKELLLEGSSSENINSMTESSTEFQYGIVSSPKKEDGKSIASTLTQKTKGFLFSTFDKLKNVIFEKNRKSFAKYKFNPDIQEIAINYMDSLTHELLTINAHTLVLFERINEIVNYFL
jgi:hypothetical protein